MRSVIIVGLLSLASLTLGNEFEANNQAERAAMMPGQMRPMSGNMNRMNMGQMGPINSKPMESIRMQMNRPPMQQIVEESRNNHKALSAILRNNPNIGVVRDIQALMSEALRNGRGVVRRMLKTPAAAAAAAAADPR